MIAIKKNRNNQCNSLDSSAYALKAHVLQIIYLHANVTFYSTVTCLDMSHSNKQIGTKLKDYFNI